MPTPASEALEALYWRGLAHAPERRVLPVGILMSDAQRGVTEDARVALNPTKDMAALEEEETFAGFIGLALNLRVAMEFADEILADPAAKPATTPNTGFTAPTIGDEVTNPMKRVLICGFRPASVNFIESIITVEPSAQVLVLVEDLQARADALDAFEAHTNLVNTGLLPGDGRPASGRIVIEVGDWTSSRQLMDLPRGFGTAVEMDVVVMVSSRRHGSDASTATALMKLEHIQEHVAADRPGQTIIAELINADLSNRLARRYAAMGRDNVTVFSIHELRAFFMFQSMIVPNFNLIYGELLAPWGQSFVKLHVSGGAGKCGFADLAAKLRADGRIVIAVELSSPHGPELFIAQGDPDDNDRVDLGRLTAIWVIRPERPNQAVAETTPPAPAKPTPGGVKPVPRPVPLPKKPLVPPLPR
jgi:hypothetical protein